MRELLELRVRGERAHLVFAEGEGQELSDELRGADGQLLARHVVRKVLVSTADPRIPEIARLQREFSAQDSYFFAGWEYHRSYTKKEVAAAELFHIRISAVFEPTGAMCGTVFDESEVCARCGSGRRQMSDLVLDLRRAPKKKDIARTIADEWIVSQRLAELWQEWGVTGYQLRPVRHKGYYDDEPQSFDYPSGRTLLEEAAKAGCPYDTMEFWVWINRPEQKPLLEQMDREHAERRERWYRTRYKPPVWYQLLVTSRPVQVSSRTRTGGEPFDEDVANEFRCERCGVIGLNILSELFVERGSWDGSDVAATAQRIGWGMGELVASPLLLFSPRLFRLMREHGIKGWKWEVAYQV